MKAPRDLLQEMDWQRDVEVEPGQAVLGSLSLKIGSARAEPCKPRRDCHLPAANGRPNHSCQPL
jgi:hypothetical protein